MDRAAQHGAGQVQLVDTRSNVGCRGAVAGVKT